MIGLVARQLVDTNWKQKQQQKVVVVVVGIIYLGAEKDVRACVRACVCMCAHLSPPTPNRPPAFFEYTYPGVAAAGD